MSVYQNNNHEQIETTPNDMVIDFNNLDSKLIINYCCYQMIFNFLFILKISITTLLTFSCLALITLHSLSFGVVSICSGLPIHVSSYITMKIIIRNLMICFEIDAEFLWIFTREQVPSDEVLDEALAVIEYNGLNQTNLVKIDHTNCTYY